MPNPPHEQRRRQAPPAGVGCIAVSFRPAIPRRVAPQQRPLALRRPRQSTSKLHSGTIEAGQPVPIFLSHPWGAVHVFAVFPGIIGERSVVFRRNPRSAAAPPSKKQQNAPLFGRCFSLFSCERTAKITTPAREIHFE